MRRFAHAICVDLLSFAGSKEELIAYNIPDVEKIRQHIGADTLAYLSHDGEERAMAHISRVAVMRGAFDCVRIEHMIFAQRSS